VTCELTIFGLGSHSATGEEWADDDNAGTAAEAQSCFWLCDNCSLSLKLEFSSTRGVVIRSLGSIGVEILSAIPARSERRQKSADDSYSATYKVPSAALLFAIRM
jgi:hypothetical protein